MNPLAAFGAVMMFIASWAYIIAALVHHLLTVTVTAIQGIPL